MNNAAGGQQRSQGERKRHSGSHSRFFRVALTHGGIASGGKGRGRPVQSAPRAHSDTSVGIEHAWPLKLVVCDSPAGSACGEEPLEAVQPVKVSSRERGDVRSGAGAGSGDPRTTG